MRYPSTPMRPLPMWALIFFLLISAIHTVLAEPTLPFSTFPISTEIEIGKVQPMVENAPKGIYMTVGGERGFRGASMAPNITELFLLDISEEVLRYNRINLELLKTPKREDYRNLRWHATYQDWITHPPHKMHLTEEDFTWWMQNIRNLENMTYPLSEALNRFGALPYAKRFIEMRDKFFVLYKASHKKKRSFEDFSKFLKNISPQKAKKIIQKHKLSTSKISLTEKDWQWWEQYGKDKNNYCSKLWLEMPEEAIDLGLVLNYKKGNYLFSDKLYQKLHYLATKNKIQVFKIDLSNPTEISQLTQRLKDSQLTLSVLDLNNLYHSDYLGQEPYQALLKALIPFANQQSKLIAMTNYKDYACGQFQAYLAFTFENVQHWPKTFSLSAFFSNWSDELLELIDGRIYEKEEIPHINTFTIHNSKAS